MLKSKKNPYQDISKVFVYSFFLTVVLLVIYFFMYLLLIKPTLISIILLIILAIVSIVISLIAGVSILFLPVSKTIKEAFDRAWLFLKKKFWLLVALIILLGVITFIISFIIEYLGLLIKLDAESVELIIQSVGNTVLIMYTTAVIACFIKKK